MPKLIASCTIRGRGDSIKINKPADGIYAYVWRMARFNSGADNSVPISAFFDLEAGVHQVTGVQVDFTVVQHFICNWLDKWSHELVKHVGEDPLAGTLRWGRALGMVR